MSSTLQAVAAKSYFSEANLPLRTRIIAMPSTTEHGRLLSEWKKLPVQLSPLTVVSGIKYIIDGTSLEQTALKSKPYPNKRDYYGRLDFPVDTIKKILLEALTTNNQLMMHITGDSATKIVLQLMKGLAAPEIWKTRRVRIEHGNGITAATAQDIKALGIIVVHTPQYGMNNPIATWLLMGIPVAIGPDGLTNPFINIAMVCSRQANKAENITREQAVIAYTKTNAYAEFAEGKKGTLTPGKVADIAVLSQDIFTVPIQLLPATRSVMTIVNGKIIFKKF
jgi:predicted amidohydrolase YtcJ